MIHYLNVGVNRTCNTSITTNKLTEQQFNHTLIKQNHFIKNLKRLIVQLLKFTHII